MWGYIISLVFIIASAVLIFFSVRQYRYSLKKDQQQILYPFYQTIDFNNTENALDAPIIKPNPADPSNNVTQISCPVGSSINIVGAYFQVLDPYLECSVGDSSTVFNAYCNPNINTAVKCVSSTQCGQGYSCYNGTCALTAYDTEEEAAAKCPALGPQFVATLNPTTQKYSCIDSNICGLNQNDVVDVVFSPGHAFNKICSPSSMAFQQPINNSCAIRDASAYLASVCNGKQTCAATFSDFGPLPCSIGLPNPSAGGGCAVDIGQQNPFLNSPGLNYDYCLLPYVNGYAGGVPNGSSTAGGGTSDPPSANMGYYIHGIFTCVPNG